ncbi:MAG: hypothetical protein KN64_14155 [Sulfurovum sp. AS07-7]|nr:MAG: hypothetical protein KN64_14095 [Sulfurovum sp. AS07-7]KIM02772.1 MAG: hypothetical protein KN64_14125 [Sulfurovum sp. AS07-7]KIM02776.1 MAG: hypothetical protein KN64_14155 [Sulfurovum sp. AS07-7]
MGLGGGDSNLYGYVLGNPVSFIDPSGLEDPRLNRAYGIHNDTHFYENFSKGSKDVVDGIIGIPEFFLAYYDYLISISGYKDLCYGNGAPDFRNEAMNKSELMYYLLKNYPLDIASALWDDFKSRPNYYIAGSSALSTPFSAMGMGLKKVIPLSISLNLTKGVGASHNTINDAKGN